jgi:hypothetical protein
MAIRELKVVSTASQRLELAKEPETWWSSMTAEQQSQYLEDHPNSKKAKEAKEKEAKQAETPTGPGSGKAKPYTPNVEEDADGDGVTDASRVGVGGKSVPTPPGIPRLPNLNPVEAAVEEKFASDYEKNPKQVASDFLEMVLAGKKPPTFGTDDAKMLTAEWSGEPGEARSARRATLNTALHQTANAVAKKAFVSHLDTLKKGDSILVTVGGCGAGKGYSLGNVDIAKDAASKANAVWDSAGDQNATENPWIQEEAEKRGLKVTYVYVHADPEVSWADPKRGVIKRANNPEDGRMVDADVFADSYAIGAKNHKAFADKNKDNPNATFIYIDSENKAPTLAESMPESALTKDRKALAKFAKDALRASDAPEPIKQGGLIGERIWGKEAASTIRAAKKPPKDSGKGKIEKDMKYSWEQYEKDEAKHLADLAKHPNAGKYGGGYKNEDKKK